MLQKTFPIDIPTPSESTLCGSLHGSHRFLWLNLIPILVYVDESSYRTWKSAKGEVGQAVKLAMQYGYKHLDCAAIYMNEAEIGEALQEVFKEGKVKREDIFITSKLW